MIWERIFGGNPLGVIVRLVVLSIVIGIVLSALGIDVYNLSYHLERLARRLYDLGFDAFHWLFQPFLVGAAIVIPIWLIARLLGGFRSRKDDRS
jgi:hypothetical protein